MMNETAENEIFSKKKWTITDSVNYHKTVRDAVRHFENTSTQIVLQGIPLVGALMSLSALLIKESGCAAVWVLVGSIIITAILAALSYFYLRLLKNAVDTATNLEDIMLGDHKDIMPYKLTKNIDRVRLAGKNEWIVIVAFFTDLGIVELILLNFYLTQMKLC